MMDNQILNRANLHLLKLLIQSSELPEPSMKSYREKQTSQTSIAMSDVSESRNLKNEADHV